MKTELPKSLEFNWVTGRKNLPKHSGVYAVQCVEKTIKNGKWVRTENKWISFGEFLPEKQTGGRWNVLHVGLHSTSYVNATDNFFDVIYWSEVKVEK